MLVLMVTDPSDRGSRTAPGRLALVQDFVNTLDVESARDRIADPEALRSWLVEHGLMDGAAHELTPADVAEVRALREGLREVLHSHHGGEGASDAVATINRVAARAPLTVVFAPDGATRLAAVGSGLDAALARLLAPIHDAVVDGTWTRLKACRAERCAWVYYDASKNRSRAWCSMAVCGNRVKSRAYRERRSSGA